MELVNPQVLFLLVTALFITAVFMHLVKKNSIAVALYLFQSIAIAVLLYLSHPASLTIYFLGALLATVIVKIIIAPAFFFWLIRRHRLTFAVSSYLNLPLTILIVAGLSALAQSSLFLPLTMIMPQNHDLLVLAAASMLISVFLSINRKGALSQMLSILSFENSIVAFALLSGLEQSSGLELGISFDILIWIIIATVFGSMVYRQFGSLDVTVMAELTEE